MLEGASGAEGDHSASKGQSVHIIGGGLAGLSAAVALAPRGYRVTILESRNRLGGRASSFIDPVTGQVIDNCQHVSMGCCTAFSRFCKTVGIDKYLEPQPTLYFMTPDRRICRFRADPLPAPLHLARAFLSAHFLSWKEKAQIAAGLARLRSQRTDDDPPFIDWLRRHRQTLRAIDRFWGLVLVSALNETVDRVGLKYARKVFVDGFLTSRAGHVVYVPRVPLARLYGEELQSWLHAHGVEVRLNCGVREFDMIGAKLRQVFTRTGATVAADAFISAVPFERLLDLLPAEIVESHDMFQALKGLEHSPITSVHLWYDRPVLNLPHVVLVDCTGQWLFNRGEMTPGEHYLQVVVSAARTVRGLGHDEIQQRIADELASLFPAAASARLIRCRTVTEQAATFSAVPGVDQLRPEPVTPIDNLFLAGDWTATGWPATMEGAVRSGIQAADAVMARGAAPLRVAANRA